MGTIIKLAIFAGIALVAINLLNADKANEITTAIHDQTGIQLDKKLNSATEFVKESSDAVVNIAKKKIEESK